MQTGTFKGAISLIIKKNLFNFLFNFFFDFLILLISYLFFSSLFCLFLFKNTLRALTLQRRGSGNQSSPFLLHFFSSPSFYFYQYSELLFLLMKTCKVLYFLPWGGGGGDFIKAFKMWGRKSKEGKGETFLPFSSFFSFFFPFPFFSSPFPRPSPSLLSQCKFLLFFLFNC